MKKRGKKVLIAMSGGVDSSVAAALLKDQGFECIGAFFITWTKEMAGLDMCPWEEDAFDARQVCDKLGIELLTFNFEQQYKERVIDYFFREYENGRTPNPDIMCNKEIKFGLFASKARELGIDYIATGHYARIVETDHQFELHKGLDPNKDQSYFLYTLQQEQLKQALFPIGELTKPKVRQLAAQYKLPNATKKDSQGICFLGHVKLRDFLQTRIPVKRGKIVDTAGTEVGEHEGTAFYTIGQRQGLKIGGAGEPYYVVAKDHATNTLIVTKGNTNDALVAPALRASTLSWVNERPVMPKTCSAKIRYRQPDQTVTITAARHDSIIASFDQPQRAITEGQSIVLYDQSRVLGGGIIDAILP